MRAVSVALILALEESVEAIEDGEIVTEVLSDNEDSEDGDVEAVEDVNVSAKDVVLSRLLDVGFVAMLVRLLVKLAVNVGVMAGIFLETLEVTDDGVMLVPFVSVEAALVEFWYGPGQLDPLQLVTVGGVVGWTLDVSVADPTTMT